MQNIMRNICFISLLWTGSDGISPLKAAAQSKDNESQSTQQEVPMKETTQDSNSAASSTASSPKTIYKLTKKDGSVTYTDKPQVNAEPIAFSVKTQNVVTSAKVSPPPPPKPKVSKPVYRVVISSPAPEATIRNNRGEFTITASQTGAPRASTYRLIFDNTPFASNTSGVFKLSGIHRGAHTYKVELTNNTGKTLASSSEQTLYLHQASALINN